LVAEPLAGYSEDLNDEEKQEANQEAVINECLFDKLVNIVAAIVDASSKTNNYLVVDRTSASGSSCTADLLLELALQHVESPPVILVIEKRSRIEKYFSNEAREQLSMIDQIESASVQHGSDQPIKQVDCNALYTPREFLSEDCFREQKYADLILPTRPDPSHILDPGKGSNVHYWSPSAEDPQQMKVEQTSMNSKRIWSYHYSQYMFSSGTHYFFVEDDQVFAPDSLGPIGGVFAHGGTLAYHRMRSWLQHGRPSVMLMNSGGVTQAFASLHNAAVRSDIVDVQRILRHVEIVSSEKWADSFGVTECMSMAELKNRAPLVMKKSIVSVDILKDSAEDVLHVVSGCFAFSTGKLPELGLRSAEAHTILRAWRQHLILYTSAVKQRRAADFYFTLQIILLFLTSAVAAVRTEYDLGTWPTSDRFEDVLYTLIVALPIASGLVATWLQKQRCLEKWAVLHASSMRVVVEIYKYRARVLDYDTEFASHKAKPKDSAKEQEREDRVVASPARRARIRFVNRVQEIFGYVLGTDMDADALTGMRRGDFQQTGPMSKEVLEQHVQRNLLQISADVSDRRHCCCGMRRKGRNQILEAATSPAGADDECAKDTLDLYGAVESDDFASIISIEAYMEHRMKPIMKLCGTSAPNLAWRLRMLERLSLFLNAVTVAFAVPRKLNITHWLVLCVTTKVLVMNVIEYAAYGMRLTAVNNGVKEMQNLLTWWESLSVIDRRTREAKTLAVGTVEQAMLKVWLARTGEVANISGGSYSFGKVGEGEEEEANNPESPSR
jgi:hypothetical protein